MREKIDLTKVELQDGQLLVIYIMLKTFVDIDLYKIVLFYMSLESYIFSKKEDNVVFDFQEAADYLDMKVEDLKSGIEKLVNYG